MEDDWLDTTLDYLQFLAYHILQVEVEVILAAHRLYNENDCLDGIDGLVELTTLSVTRWANQQQYKALASLAAGKPPISTSVQCQVESRYHSISITKLVFWPFQLIKCILALNLLSPIECL